MCSRQGRRKESEPPRKEAVRSRKSPCCINKNVFLSNIMTEKNSFHNFRNICHDRNRLHLCAQLGSAAQAMGISA